MQIHIRYYSTVPCEKRIVRQGYDVFESFLAYVKRSSQVQGAILGEGEKDGVRV